MSTQHWLNTDLGGAFGQHDQFGENLVPLGTTSAVFAQYLRVTTPVVPAGTYALFVVFQYSASTASTVGEYQLQLNDAIVLETQTLIVSSAGEEKTYSNIGQATLAAGSYTIDVEIRRSSGSGTFTIDDAKIMIWRVQ